ncbi:MAG: putative secreted protein [Candidatus Phytoplasma australasiaticum]|uniref:Effector n=1 Tax=Peanut witches'-broom phytoplasma NTU2011 TaxID=1163385 RepID=A0ABN0J7X4_PEWBP|nr:putative effector [Peanut witches'-broom phytoplasma NTU2011]MDV3142827.1 hypothetical protein [Sweet potato little leaf phytoplasma]MDV3197681.1 hypothetical protein [Candidatus Phytoplasma australasiaticum]QLL36679.1 putative secreted protein ['Echinacea purpurea' witches'-broom phytoplasma]WEX20166.1 MAG: putative secreted protein [Candidatus Phytoplasma aurantifolia]
MKKPLNFNKKFIGLSLLIFSVLIVPLIMFCSGVFESSYEVGSSEDINLEGESILDSPELTQSQDKVRKFGRLI